MHGVGGEPDELGPRRREALGAGGQQVAGLMPLAGALHRLDGGEVDRVQQDRGRVQAAEATRRLLVQHAIVVGGGFPAHAADEADGLHASPFLKRTTRSVSAKPQRAWLRRETTLSSSASEPSSVRPRARAQASTAATRRRAIPCRRKAGSTRMPSSQATGAVSQPSPWRRCETSTKPTG